MIILKISGAGKYYTESKLDNGVETNEVGPRSREENRL